MSLQQEKKKRLLELLERGMVMVHLDARARGVRVPDAHSTNPAMALNLSYRFQIPDFRVDDKGVFASLSFNQVPHSCTIPWDALYAMRSHVDDTMHVWVEDIPAEIVERAQVLGQELDHQDSSESETKSRASASILDRESAATDESSGPEGRATSVPYLRVIK